MPAAENLSHTEPVRAMGLRRTLKEQEVNKRERRTVSRTGTPRLGA